MGQRWLDKFSEPFGEWVQSFYRFMNYAVGRVSDIRGKLMMRKLLSSNSSASEVYL